VSIVDLAFLSIMDCYWIAAEQRLSRVSETRRKSTGINDDEWNNDEGKRMLRKQVNALLAAITGTVLLVLVISTPAQATTPTKLELMYAWTQPNSGSYAAWDDARQHQGDWATDYCTTSPDQPLGFDFRMPCWHHDWGYRNYHAMNQFDANKSRVDDTFYFDLKEVCKRYPAWKQPVCNSLAWTYYEAVRQFGTLAAVDPADIDRAADAPAQAETNHVAR
jgi:Prokaryotic phospholipase A2